MVVDCYVIKLHKYYRAVTDQKSPACTAFAHEGQAAPSMDTVWVVTLPVCLSYSTVQCNVYRVLAALYLHTFIRQGVVLKLYSCILIK